MNRQTSSHESNEEKRRSGTVFVQFISVADCLVTTAVFFEVWLYLAFINMRSHASHAREEETVKKHWFQESVLQPEPLESQIFFLGSSRLEEIAEIQAISALDI